jgi:GMP synthase (glutamine-hydrolysing)
VRALHLINFTGGPADLFLPPLRARGFAIDDVNPHHDLLPPSLEGYDVLLVTGGTANTHETDRYPWLEPEIDLIREAVAHSTPVIGLCLGAQLLTKAIGGTVYAVERPEVGWHEVRTQPEAADDPVLGALPPSFVAMQWHSYACELPSSARELAANEVCVQAFRAGEAAWGTQFHIEVTRDILLDWQRQGGDELAANGYDEERFAHELDLHLEPHMAIGRDMAERFAAVAARVARPV